MVVVVTSVYRAHAEDTSWLAALLAHSTTRAINSRMMLCVHFFLTLLLCHFCLFHRIRQSSAGVSF